MRVTIEHREESAGLTGGTKHHYVDCAVAFGEEEKAIIKARDLYDHNFVVRPATPPPSQVAYVGSGVLNSLGRLGVLAGIIMGLIAAATGGALGTIAGLTIFFGVCLWALGALNARSQDKRLEQPEQRIRLRALLNDGRFSVWAASPADAQGVDQEIRDALTNVKALISASGEIKAKQTFEL